MAVKINGVEVGWSQIKVSSTTDLGIGEDDLILSGITEITFKKTRVKEKKYGLGKRAQRRGFGNEECEASIKFYTSMQQALRGQLNSLMELGEFDLTIAFDNNEFEIEDIPVGSNVVVLKRCLFTEDGWSMAQGDTSGEETFDLDPMDIVFNIE